MDTNPSAPSHDEFRASAAAFIAAAVEADEHCPGFGAIMPPALHDRARAWQRRVHEAGFAGIHWPEEYGGRGLDRSYTAIWSEECAKARVQPYLNLQGLILAGEAILRSGTDEQKRRYLPSTLSGETLWCQLFSEPDAGSDLAGLKATAVRDGEHYVLNGQKVWCSNGQFAEQGILLARTDPTEPGHRGISFFLLDMATPGVDVRPLTQMTGDQEFCEVFLDDAETPVDTLLGPEHGGWLVAMEVLQDERGSSGASGLISLERRLAYLASLKGDDQVLGDELMRLLVRGHALKAMLMRSGAGPAAASAAKLLRTELEFDAELLEATLRGADGMLAGESTDRMLYAPGMKIAGGSSEIQRNIIGERLLGLPREPRP
ncbi:acyl-CoA dehydrogenase family protein [Ilumatobacter fluminis]|uniref:acyl-CoA dehydrogenase family protein n=1 Tax=Ilumatobacter fluminis TaxID=467091 RepID=UPI002444FFF4|nr:acyl-CoA dehydrogenase family protein [Ilumatobacter fluminis]